MVIFITIEDCHSPALRGGKTVEACTAPHSSAAPADAKSQCRANLVRIMVMPSVVEKLLVHHLAHGK
jgi:hypothetical protein